MEITSGWEKIDGIPDGAILDTLTPDTRADIEAWLETDPRSAVLVIHGAVGTGKTWTASSIARVIAVSNPGRDPFGPAVVCGRDERRWIGEFAEAAQREDHWLRTTGTVVIDDFGVDPGRHIAPEDLVHYLDNRQGRLIITTARDAAELVGIYGERAMSRITAHARVITLTGPDRRNPDQDPADAW